MIPAQRDDNVDDEDIDDAVQDNDDFDDSTARKSSKSSKKGGRKAIYDSEDDEGEETARPSRTRIGMYSDGEDDEEEDEDELDQMTDADRGFIVDDDEEDAGEDENAGSGGDDEGKSRKRRKKKRKREKEREPDQQDELVSNLSEDDLDLINENIGGGSSSKSGFRRIRKKGEKKQDEVARLFDEDEEQDDDLRGEDDEPGSQKQKRAEKAFDKRELYDDEDDIEDFIVNDDEEGREDSEEVRREKQRRRRERLEFAKNLGAGLGISDGAWTDIQELFGDGSDYAYALYPDQVDHDETQEGDDFVVDQTRKAKETRLTDVYEPTAIAEKMLTEEDERIRIRDIPERFQLAGIMHLPDESEIDREVEFILYQLKDSAQSKYADDELYKLALRNILYFLRHELLEVPFIYAHRKDFFNGRPLQIADLWRIYDLNEQFLIFEKKRQTATAIIHDLSRVNPQSANDLEVDTLIKKRSTLDDMNDLLEYLQLSFSSDLTAAHADRGSSTRSLKRASWRREYEDAKKNNIHKLSRMFDIDIRRFSESISTMQILNIPSDPDVAPLAAAVQFVCPRFPTVEKVLQAARLIVAHDIGVYPFLRKFVRKVYMSDAVVSVHLTDKGRRNIEPNHPYYPFKYVKEKHIFKFVDAQFLQMLAAESEGLITLSIHVDEEQRLIKDLIRHICNDLTSQNADLWNEQRRMICMHAAKNILFPQCVKWLRNHLATNATNWLRIQCQERLEHRINMSPYYPAGSNIDDDEIEGSLPFVTVTWGEGGRGDPTFVAAINDDGLLSEYIKLDGLNQREPKAESKSTFIAFIARHKPAAIGVGGFKPNTLTSLLELVKEMIRSAQPESKVKSDTPVLMVEDEVARVYMHSRRAEREFPEKDYPPYVRYLVSLARKMQDPTQEFAGLFNTDDDIKSVRVH
eukprot:jgi/Hompol1/4635/HPOL_003774-RA